MFTSWMHGLPSQLVVFVHIFGWVLLGALSLSLWGIDEFEVCGQQPLWRRASGSRFVTSNGKGPMVLWSVTSNGEKPMVQGLRIQMVKD